MITILQCYAINMKKLLIKLNIVLLILILPLQGFAAATMVACQSMHDVRAEAALVIAAQPTTDSKNPDLQSAATTEDCHGASAKNSVKTKSATDKTTTICPHCFACGIYAPALLTFSQPLTVKISEHVAYRELDSRFTSFIPQTPLHPPSPI